MYTLLKRETWKKHSYVSLRVAKKEEEQKNRSGNIENEEEDIPVPNETWQEWKNEL